MADAPYPLHFSDIAGAPQIGSVLCKLSDLADNVCVELKYRQGDKLFYGFICEQAGQVRAYENRCPHAGTPLNISDGKFYSSDGANIMCTTHGALFNPKNGRCIRGPCKDEWLRQLVIKIDGDYVLSG